MCGRFVLRIPLVRIIEAIAPLTPPLNVLFPPRYNIAPTQKVPVARLDKDDHPIISLVHWGLIPSWVKDALMGNRMINARAETAADKPAFRTALARRRCLVPADGFYEWKKTGSHKQPMFIHRRDDGLFCFAGLWERWHNPTGQDIDSMTILTTEPNALMREIHDRMPVILEPADYEAWLKRDTPAAQVQSMLKPIAADDFMADPVSSRVNSPAIDDPACVLPIKSVA